MHGWLVMAVLMSADPAPAQAKPEIIIDAKPSGVVDRDLTTGVALPPPGPGRDAFLSGSMSVDMMLNEVSLGHRPLKAKDFYLKVGRPDLAAWAEERTRQRIWLISGGGLILAAGVVTGLAVIGTGPSTSSPECGQGSDANAYNKCLDRAEKAQMTGAVLIGAGLIAGGVLIVWGMSTPEMVTPAEETLRLATEYNK